MKEIQYAILFVGVYDNTKINGYYSKKQPKYDWSFTNDIYIAKLWKNKKGAENFILHQQSCSYRALSAKIIKIEVTINHNIID